MAAFNWIIFDNRCPVCSEMTKIRAQTHVASTFEGDEQGRYCNMTYRPKDKMRWWDKGDERYANWTLGGNRVIGDTSDDIRECCYAICSNRNDRLYAIVKFSNLTVEDILEIGPEERWPTDYRK